jgi:hypothetical protein
MSADMRACIATAGQFKDATKDGPYVDSEFRCRVCGRFALQHPDRPGCFSAFSYRIVNVNVN